MNKEKYKDSFYEPRELTDLRDMIKGSAALYGSRPAFMVKDQHKSPYRPISFMPSMINAFFAPVCSTFPGSGMSSVIV